MLNTRRSAAPYCAAVSTKSLCSTQNALLLPILNASNKAVDFSVEALKRSF